MCVREYTYMNIQRHSHRATYTYHVIQQKEKNKVLGKIKRYINLVAITHIIGHPASADPFFLFRLNLLLHILSSL